jgi:hypothetical protein
MMGIYITVTVDGATTIPGRTSGAKLIAMFEADQLLDRVVISRDSFDFHERQD